MQSQMVQFRNQKPNADFPEVKDVTPQEVWEKRSEITVIDVRRPDEFSGELGHIPGAQLVVLDVLPEQVQDLPRDKTIVFVCRSGGRSARACDFAAAQGLTHIYNMQGGMLAWNSFNLQVEGRSNL